MLRRVASVSTVGLNAGVHTNLLLLLLIPLHFHLLSVHGLVILLLAFQHLLMHSFLIRNTLALVCRLKLTHVVQLSAATAIALVAREARVQSESAALLRD